MGDCFLSSQKSKLKQKSHSQIERKTFHFSFPSYEKHEKFKRLLKIGSKNQIQIWGWKSRRQKKIKSHDDIFRSARKDRSSIRSKKWNISPSKPTDFCMIIKLSLVSQILPIHTFLDRSSLKKSSHQNPDSFQAKSPSSLLFSHFFSTIFFSKLSCFQLSSQCAKIV